MGIPKFLLDAPFGAEAARELCRLPNLFEDGRDYKRDVIVSRLQRAFKQCGGREEPAKQKVVSVFKGWERSGDRPFKKVTRGWYKFLRHGDLSVYPSPPSHPGLVGNGQSDHEPLAPDRSWGSGPYEVYAWYLPRYRTGSVTRWPIQIGRTGTDGLPRKLQALSKDLPERPHYLVRIGCSDEDQARQRESLLHAYFDVRKHRVEDVPGDWFNTNADEIDDAIRTLMFPKATHDLRTGPIEDAIGDAFRGASTEDWERLPADLTDNLDHYLYGTDKQ